MMHNYFEVKVRYEKVNGDGMNQKVTEPYLFDALSFTEAEARTIEEITPYISGEFTVTNIKRENFSEVFLYADEGDYFFKARIAFVTLDDKSNKEKKTHTNVLVQANDLQQAKDRVVEQMKGTMADYEIVRVAKTDIVDVYPYTPDESKKPELENEDKKE